MALRKTKGKGKSKEAESPENQAMEVQREILARINGLIFLLAEGLPRPVPEPDATNRKGKKSKPLSKSEELAVRLSQAGLRPIEIAGYTGRHPNNISRDLSKARKQGRLPGAK
jgi:hypothetical protein